MGWPIFRGLVTAVMSRRRHAGTYAVRTPRGDLHPLLSILVTGYDEGVHYLVDHTMAHRPGN